MQINDCSKTISSFKYTVLISDKAFSNKNRFVGMRNYHERSKLGFAILFKRFVRAAYAA